ncbi:hypothetical protein DSUL_50346 [Desulfovibrionales bacterium]
MIDPIIKDHGLFQNQLWATVITHGNLTITSTRLPGLKSTIRSC